MPHQLSACEAAQRLARRELTAENLLHGLPLSVKDIFDTARLVGAPD